MLALDHTTAVNTQGVISLAFQAEVGVLYSGPSTQSLLSS